MGGPRVGADKSLPDYLLQAHIAGAAKVPDRIIHSSHICPQILVIIEDICDSCLPFSRWKQSPTASCSLDDGVECAWGSHQIEVNREVHSRIYIDII